MNTAANRSRLRTSALPPSAPAPAPTWTINPAERIFDASPDADARYNPAQFGITNRVVMIYEHLIEIPREYDGRLEFGGTYLRGDLNRTKRLIREQFARDGLLDVTERVLVCIDIESTPENWEQLKASKPLAAAAVLEDMEGDEKAAAAEHARQCFRWHSAIAHYIRRICPGALVTFYNAPWMHRAREAPGHFARYHKVCDWFTPSLYWHDEDHGIPRVRHARQIAGPDRPVIPMIYPDDIGLAADYIANGASAVAVWSTHPPEFYAYHMQKPEAQRLTRWPIEELIPA